MSRLVLRDAQWKQVAPLLPGKPGEPGRSAADNRLFLEAVLWMARAGAPWRDLPDQLELELNLQALPTMGKKCVFESLFKVLSGDPDFEYAMIDATIRVHQHGTGAKGGRKIRPSALIPSRPEGRAAA